MPSRKWIVQRRGCGLVHDDIKKCENAVGGDMVNMSKAMSRRDGHVCAHVPLKLDWAQNGRSDWLPGQRSRRRGQTKQQPTVPLAINGTRATVRVRRRAIPLSSFSLLLDTFPTPSSVPKSPSKPESPLRNPQRPSSHLGVYCQSHISGTRQSSCREAAASAFFCAQVFPPAL